MLMTHTFFSLQSFYPRDLHSNVTHLQNALQHISCHGCLQISTLNTSKTEFLHLGFKQQ